MERNFSPPDVSIGQVNSKSWVGPLSPIEQPLMKDVKVEVWFLRKQV